MSHRIIERENETSSLEKLAAQRQIYSVAKVFFILQTSISVLLLVLLSFTQLIIPKYDFTLIIATISLFAVVIDYYLDIYVNSLKEKAAKIQEYFDTYVFQLNWNNILCLEKPEYDKIYHYSQKHKNKSDFSELSNWYEPEINNLSENVAILICQKTNCNYDKSIRKRFNSVFLWIGIITLCLILIFTIFSGISLAKILLTVIFPAIPIIQWTMKNINSNNQSISTLEQLNSLINTNWELVKSGSNINKIELRQIQDGIYLNRKNSSLIPDYVYNKMRKKLEAKTRYTVNELVEELNSENNCA